MTVGNVPSHVMGWTAVATGVAGLLGLVLLILFYTVGQPIEVEKP